MDPLKLIHSCIKPFRTLLGEFGIGDLFKVEPLHLHLQVEGAELLGGPPFQVPDPAEDVEKVLLRQLRRAGWTTPRSSEVVLIRHGDFDAGSAPLAEPIGLFSKSLCRNGTPEVQGVIWTTARLSRSAHAIAADELMLSFHRRVRRQGAALAIEAAKLAADLADLRGVDTDPHCAGLLAQDVLDDAFPFRVVL